MLQRGTALSVKFTASDARSVCQQWIEARGKQGEFWSRIGRPDEQQSVACIFTNASGARVEIDDGGSQLLAQPFCAFFAGEQGWTEDTHAEQAVVNQANKAQQRAAATEQAEQQVGNDAGAVVSDFQNLKDATSALAGDSLTADLSGLQSDLGTVHSDLQTVQTDSSDVACGDAGLAAGDEGTMEGDDGTMEGDIGTYQHDVESAVSAIAAMRRDDAAYLADSAAKGYVSSGVPTATQIDAAISSATAAVAKEHAAFARARSQAAQLIALAKGYVAQANAVCTRAGG